MNKGETFSVFAPSGKRFEENEQNWDNCLWKDGILGKRTEVIRVMIFGKPKLEFRTIVPWVGIIKFCKTGFNYKKKKKRYVSDNFMGKGNDKRESLYFV